MYICRTFKQHNYFNLVCDTLWFILVPNYLNEIYDDTIQTIERELSQTLKLAFEFTGKLTYYIFMMSFDTGIENV